MSERVARQLVEARERRAARRATYAEFARARAAGVVRRHQVKLGLEVPPYADRPHLEQPET